MSDTRRVSFHLNMEDALQRKAWECLETMDRNRFKSRREAVTLAVVDYFDRLERQRTDPDWEAREREERFVSRIVGAVEREIARTLPAYLAGCAAAQSGLNVPVAQAVEPPANIAETPVPDGDIDWDFLGG